MEWVRRWVRRNTRPVPRQKARLYHNRLSIIYYMLAWTAAGIAFLKMFTIDPSTLPENLDVHADPNGKNKASVHHVVDLVRKPSQDTEVKIFTFKNFTIQSVEEYKTRNLQQQAEETKLRAIEDFFGGTEDSPNEEHDLSV